jgi:hypothetical protein
MYFFKDKNSEKKKKNLFALCPVSFFSFPYLTITNSFFLFAFRTIVAHILNVYVYLNILWHVLLVYTRLYLLGPICNYYFYYILVGLGFELGPLNLQSRHSLA